MFTSPDRLTFHLKNPTLFSRKVGKPSDFLTNIFQEHFVHSTLVTIWSASVPSAIFQRFFASKSAMQLFLAATICNKDHNAAKALDNFCRANKPMFRAHFSDDFSADRPTDRPAHFLGLEMTRTQLICDPRLVQVNSFSSCLKKF